MFTGGKSSLSLRFFSRKSIPFADIFLWSGSHNDRKSGVVAWGNICNPKKGEELGFRNLELWNTFAMGKLAWHISQDKKNLWIKWVNCVYIQDNNWSS